MQESYSIVAAIWPILPLQSFLHTKILKPLTMDNRRVALNHSANDRKNLATWWGFELMSSCTRGSPFQCANYSATTSLSDFGIPRVILVHNGGKFTAQVFRSLCKTHTITIAYITPYHLQRNSVTERKHRTLKSILACLCNGHPLRWPKLLSRC